MLPLPSGVSSIARAQMHTMVEVRSSSREQMNLMPLYCGIHPILRSLQILHVITLLALAQRTPTVRYLMISSCVLPMEARCLCASKPITLRSWGFVHSDAAFVF